MTPPRGLGGELLAGGLASGGLAGGLLGTGHFGCVLVQMNELCRFEMKKLSAAPSAKACVAGFGTKYAWILRGCRSRVG